MEIPSTRNSGLLFRMIRKFIKKITHPFLKFGAQKFFSKPRLYSYNDIEVKVMPEVFPPHYTLSTKILLDYIQTLDLKHKTFLELGCGSGIISLLAASKGALVTASDINKIALNALEIASKKNDLTLKIVHSDLFDSIEEKHFNHIFINPPYYPKTPKNIKESAWFCGVNFEYFEKLFQQLTSRSDNNIIMILSEDCNIEKIQQIASKNRLQLECILKKKVAAEKNFIFKITSQ